MKPTTPSGSPVISWVAFASTLWWASMLSGITAAASSASTTPSAAAVAGDVSRERDSSARLCRACSLAAPFPAHITLYPSVRLVLPDPPDWEPEIAATAG
jgi:hypothetical protein